MSTVFFTIVARNYVSYARVLCKSIRKSHPYEKIYIAISDSKSNIPAIDVENCEIITLDQLNLPNPKSFELRYDVMELSTAIKPYVFNWLFLNTSAQKFVYLDPDILVITPLSEALECLGEDANLVLTPHLLSPISDNYLPSEITMLRVGVYNLGFIGVFRSLESMRAIAWWADRLERGAVVDLENGLFTDQKWVDLFPTLFSGVKILRNEGYNVAYWNLKQREITCVNEKWFANNDAIVFVHFSGIDPLNPKQFSKHQNRISISDIGPLRKLFDLYLESLLDNGYRELIKIPYELGKLDGVKVGSGIRTYFKLFLDDVLVGDSIGTGNNKLQLSYFNELEERIPKNTVVSRYMYGIYLSRRDLQSAFNLGSSNGINGFSMWCVNYFQSSRIENPEFLESLLKRLQKQKTKRLRDLHYKILNYVSKIIFNTLAFSYKHLPKNFKDWIKKLIPHQYRQKIFINLNKYGINLNTQRNLFPPLHLLKLSAFSNILNLFKMNHTKVDGVSLYGYLKGDFGVAENLRSMAGSLKKNNYSFDIVEIDPGPSYSLSRTIFDELTVKKSGFNIEIFCINADQLPQTFSKLNIIRDSKKYRIGYWFWELSKFPSDWIGSIDYVDELWAPTKYIQQTLSLVTKKPVIHMPVAVEFDATSHFRRIDYGLPDNKFLYLFSYDLHSFSTRKNPNAALNAFLEEFKSSDNAGLVIKTIYGEQHPTEFQNLLNLAKSDNRIYVINEALSRAQMYSLIEACDCYISLHRAEGFGLGMAEAMYLGKPVIGTGYSGNLDFMNEENSCLVDYDLISVGDGQYPFAVDQVWANPNINTARSFMRKIFDDVNYREHIALAGQATIREHHSFDKVGIRMTKRLSEIRSSMRGSNV